MARLGNYELGREIGRGASGIVYEAEHLVFGLRAIKTMPLPKEVTFGTEAPVERFRREAKAAEGLNHPNIVRVFDYGETDELAYIVMEYIDAPSLAVLLKERQRLPVSEILPIMRGLLAGLAYSHGFGIVHRDIKPSNIMLTKTGQVKITDFGIARIEDSTLTSTGVAMGTPAYMPPEQFDGAEVDLRADIHAAGVVLFEMLTGRRPFVGTFTQIAQQLGRVVRPLPSSVAQDVPKAFDAVVARAMALEPDERYPNARKFLAAIEAAALVEADATVPEIRRGATSASETVEVPPGVDPPVTPLGRRNRPVWIWVGAGAIAAVAALGLVLIFWPVHPVDPDPTPPDRQPPSTAEDQAKLAAVTARREDDRVVADVGKILARFGIDAGKTLAHAAAIRRQGDAALSAGRATDAQTAYQQAVQAERDDAIAAINQQLTEAAKRADNAISNGDATAAQAYLDRARLLQAAIASLKGGQR